MKWSSVVFGLFLAAFCLFQSEGRAAVPVTFTLEELTGIPGEISLEGPAPSVSLYLPVLPGMRFQDAVLTLEYVASSRLAPRATLSVYGEDVLLATFEVFPGTRSVHIPLAPLEGMVLQDTLRLTLRGDLSRSENLCEDLLSRDLFVRIRAKSTLSAVLEETTWTVRDFFRFPASRVRILLPEKHLSRELLGAYLKLAAFLRRSRHAVLTEPLPERLPEAEDPKERRIVLRENALRDVELRGATLYLTPRGVSGVLAELSLFAGTSFRVQSGPSLPARKRTLQDFGVRSTTLRGIGELRQSVYFTLADLGGVPSSLELVLLSSTIPLPETPRGEAFLKVFLNGNLVFTRRITRTSKQGIHRDTIFLPPRLLGRENALDIVFSYFPEVGECRRGTMPFEATIFEQSYFSGTFREPAEPPTFADAPTRFSGKAWVVLPEKPSLEEVEVMARLYSALREIDATPLVLEVVHELPRPQWHSPRLSLPLLFEALRTKSFLLLFTPPASLPEYFLIFDRDGKFASVPALPKNGTLTLSPLPHLETLAITPDTPAGILVARNIAGKPALVFTPLGREDVACHAFLRHFQGAQTLRTMAGNVAIFTPEGWGETRAGSSFPPADFASRWRLFILAGACCALAVWCVMLYRKLVRLRMP